jgi:hypothetical protein
MQPEYSRQLSLIDSQLAISPGRSVMLLRSSSAKGIITYQHGFHPIELVALAADRASLPI